ncbi:hypothetical protein ASPZODRAFT_133421 [Penicilliopsis zonata CBS 506.65]|uniref:Protein DML1 n=1 Tax=Penicilliopsis zonata CBS 506.65 TaxID=1073090 RepID=A0A1L9SEG7_9EURO|nr:hypothetical protein ASPZODRAFT_133421 [Penicilliopsis zonata CBS 506.65]OJJ45581.1 hypothetical protein ASPZODRAFT_133421 [Penicilliopsis zonata CBS 506.65]
MHEIITLQLGQRANYLATHFWNLQESYFTYNESEEPLVDHDVHFRPGLGADGSETFTPRTLIYDLKGSFGTLRKYNALYELSEELNGIQGLWDGKEIIQQQAAIPQSAYQNSLDQGLPAPTLTTETVRYWSDFNRVFYHPRSIVQLNDYELNSTTMPFEDWAVGEELFKDLDKEHDLLDRDLRPFAEECDQIRALQLYTSSDDAWGGFSARYVDRLRDEFGKKSIWVWAIESGAKVQRSKQLKQEMNRARSVHSISPQSSLYVPIIDPPTRLPNYVNIDPHSEWHTSALICSAIESITLPSRLRQYYDIESSLAGDDDMRRIFELQSSIIQDGSGKGTGVSTDRTRDESISVEKRGTLRKAESQFDIDFTYDNFKGKEIHVFNQIEVTRGISGKDRDESNCNEDQGFARKQRFYDSEPALQRFNVPLPFPILDSFPGHILPTSHPEAGVQILSALTTSSRTAERIRAMQVAAGRIIELDERETIYNGLGEIREYYESGWMSGSDSDDE